MSKQVSPLFTPITELQIKGNPGKAEKRIILLNEVNRLILACIKIHETNWSIRKYEHIYCSLKDMFIHAIHKCRLTENSPLAFGCWHHTNKNKREKQANDCFVVNNSHSTDDVTC